MLFALLEGVFSVSSYVDVNSMRLTRNPRFFVLVAVILLQLEQKFPVRPLNE